MARQRVERVPIERLSFGLSPRVESCDPDHVAALTEVLDELPPILVHAPTMRVIDGVHRVLATRARGQAAIRAVMFEGDETAARIEAVRSNVTHGKPLTMAEREVAAVEIIERVPEWSDRRIAAVAGLSPKTIARLRHRATVDPTQSRARIGRDGRARPVDPSEVRRRVADALRSNPDASNRSIARHTGASQGTVRDVRERLRRGMSAELRPIGGSEQQPDQPDVLAEFATWFERCGIEDGDWQAFVSAIPLSRVYEVADACRRRSDSWRAFSVALEDRARAHRRSAIAKAVKESGLDGQTSGS